MFEQEAKQKETPVRFRSIFLRFLFILLDSWDVGFPVLIRMGGKISDDWVVVLVFLASFAKRDFLGGSVDEGFCHIVATSVSARAAIIVREHVFHFFDARIFLDVEEFSG